MRDSTSTYGFQSSFGSTRVTWGVQRLILLTTACYVLQLLLLPLETWLGAPRLSAWWLGFEPGAFLRGFLWQAITYQFLHGGVMHLFMNMLWLFFFGPEVERLLGTRQFYGFYLACGAIGVLATLFPLVLFGVNPVVTGASGSVMGVLVAFAMIDPKRQFFLVPIPVPVSAVGMVALVVVMNLVSGLNGGAESVATHLGGMGAGYLLMIAIPKWHSWQRERRMRNTGSAPGKEKGKAADKVGEAVDNIFKFKDPR